MSVAETCRYLNLSRATIYRMMQDGSIPFHVIRGRRRVRPIDLDAYVATTYNRRRSA